MALKIDNKTNDISADSGQVSINGAPIRSGATAPVGFSAVPSGVQALTGNAWNKVNCGTEEYDAGNAYDAANSRFQPTTAGFYLITGSVRVSPTVSELVAGIYKNGALVKSGSDLSTSSVQAIVSSVLYLNGSTDYVELYGYVSAAANTVANIWNTYFQGSFVGASTTSGVANPNLVAEVVFSGSATSYTFSDLDGITDGWYELEIEKDAGAACNLQIYVNGNTTPTNYWCRDTFGNSGGLATSSTNAAPYVLVNTASNPALAKVFCTMMSNGLFFYSSDTVQGMGSAAAPTLETLKGNSNFTIANITSLTITSSIANGIGAGTKIRLLRGKFSTVVPSVANPSLVAEYTIPANQTAYTFSGLDGNNDGGYDLVIEQADGVAASLYLHVNGDTTVANYWNQYLVLSGATVSGNRNNNSMVCVNDAVGKPSFATVACKRLSTGVFAFSSDIARNMASAAPEMLKLAGMSVNTITNITSLTVTASVANGIAAGSVLRLYRKKFSTISGSGSAPANQTFLAHMNATNQTLANNTYAKLALTTKDKDSANTFDITNLKHTPSLAGDYLYDIGVGFTNGVSGTLTAIELRKNGAVYKSFYYRVPATNDCALNMQAIVPMNGSTDYVEVFVYQNSGSAQTINGAKDRSYVSGSLLATGSGAKQVIPIAASDETTALTAGTGKVTFRMPFAFTLSDVRASLTTAQTSGSILTVDINEAGTSILSTKLTIDNTEKTSTTAAALPIMSDNVLADDAEITIDIDQVGDGTAKGLKIYLIGQPA